MKRLIDYRAAARYALFSVGVLAFMCLSGETEPMSDLEWLGWVCLFSAIGAASFTALGKLTKKWDEERNENTDGRT